MSRPLQLLPLLSTASLLVACGVGELDQQPPVQEPGGGDGSGGGDGNGGGGEGSSALAGEVTEDLSLSGQVELSEDATIAAGVTVTIEAGAELSIGEGVTITVLGSLLAQGSDTARITMHPSSGALTPDDNLEAAWSGFVVESGASARISNVDGSGVATLLYCKEGALQCELEGSNFNTVGNILVAEGAATITASSIETLGTISVRGTGSLDVVDSRIFNSNHDIIVASGGDLSIDHSEIGGAQGSYEHCNLHVGAANSLSVTNSNITSAVYGLMIGGVTGAVFSNNNFTLNETSDVLEVGTVANVDMSSNYWDGGAPADLGAAYDVSNALAAPVATAGPRL